MTRGGDWLIVGLLGVVAALAAAVGIPYLRRWWQRRAQHGGRDEHDNHHRRGVADVAMVCVGCLGLVSVVGAALVVSWIALTRLMRIPAHAMVGHPDFSKGQIGEDLLQDGGDEIPRGEVVEEVNAFPTSDAAAASAL